MTKNGITSRGVPGGKPKEKVKDKGENTEYRDKNLEIRSLLLLEIEHPFPKTDNISNIRKLLDKIILYLSDLHALRSSTQMMTKEATVCQVKPQTCIENFP